MFIGKTAHSLIASVNMDVACFPPVGGQVGQLKRAGEGRRKLNRFYDEVTAAEREKKELAVGRFMSLVNRVVATSRPAIRL